jgi:hypothetical protein
MLNINITSTKDIESEVDTQLDTIASNQDLIGLNETQKQERSKEFFGAFNQFLTDQVLRSFEELDELRQDARDVQKEIAYYKELMGEGGATGPLVDNSKPLLETLNELRQERTSVEQVRMNE